MKDTKTSIEKIKSLNKVDLADLCNITEQAIKTGGGFGWLKIPTRENLIKYWKGILLIPNRIIFVGRINNTIAGSTQLVLQTQNNEAQKISANLVTHFVAPWARGFGLARNMIKKLEDEARNKDVKYIQLDVRETQDAAIKCFETLGYIKWGINPHYAEVEGKDIRGYYYYKYIK